MFRLVDGRPPPWLTAVLRAPVVLFRLRLGWLFGRRLLLLSHVGRRSGRERAAVVEVVGHEHDPPVWYVAAAWGERSDWYRNLNQNPNAEITVGRDRHRVVAKVVDIDHAAAVHAEYVREHPWAAYLIGRMLGIDLTRSDPRVLAERIPLIALIAADAAGDSDGAVAPVVGTHAEVPASDTPRGRDRAGNRAVASPHSEQGGRVDREAPDDP